jgi:hypothetical protein
MSGLKTPAKKSRTSRKVRSCPPCRRVAVLPAPPAVFNRRRKYGSGPRSSVGCTVKKPRVGKTPNKYGKYKCREIPANKAARLACKKDPTQCDKTYRSKRKAAAPKAEEGISGILQLFA